MSGHRSGGGRRKAAHHEEEHESEERWLLTYADMITLLMTLFMVLFAISSVNTSKLDALSKSLSEALNGKVVTGGKSIQQTGSTDSSEKAPPEPPIPAITPSIKMSSPTTSANPSGSPNAAQHEQEEFSKLKQQIDAYAREHGLKQSLETEIGRNGLVIRLLTDRILFGSGQARLEPASSKLLTEIAGLLVAEVRHPIVVEGHTDSTPIASSQFPTNWELSTTRSTQVVRFLINHRVAARRLQAAGVGAQRPIASNKNESGRSQNRRVEIVLVRLNDPSTP